MSGQRLFLIASIAGADVAIDAAGIESVVKLKDIVPAPSTPPVVAGLCALRSRVLTVLDCRQVVTGEATPIAGAATAIVMPIGGHSYALVVDAVRDVVASDEEPENLRRPTSGGWGRVAGQTVRIAERTLLLIEAERFLDSRIAQAA